MPVRVTPEQLATKWGNRLKGSIEEMRNGANRVTVAPGVQAAAKADKWQARLTESATKAKWQRNVARISVDEWRKRYVDKGLSRVASGVDASTDKMTEFATQLIAHQNAGLQTLSTMPDLTLEDSINRMGAWIRHMAKFQMK